MADASKKQERVFRFAVHTCMGGIDCMITLRGFRRRRDAEARAYRYMAENYSQDTCDQCGDNVWSLCAGEQVSDELGYEPTKVELTAE